MTQNANISVSGFQTCLAPQNDHLNLSFVKDIHVVAKEITRSGLKTAIYYSQISGNTL